MFALQAARRLWMILTWVGAVAALAQTPTVPASGRSFEVASVKLNKSGSPGMRTKFRPGGHFTATNVTVRSLVVMAYDLRDFELAGGPSWIDSERYDIDAKGQDSAAQDVDQRTDNSKRILMMIQSLLAKRFKLAVHKELREGTVYWLVVAKNGLKIKEPAPAKTKDSNGSNREPEVVLNVRNGELHAEGIKMADLPETLMDEVGRPVIDKTNLLGDYSFDLKWAPNSSHSAVQDETNGPSIFTALQEQVGLKLEAHKAPVNVLVIDHVERGSEN